MRSNTYLFGIIIATIAIVLLFSTNGRRISAATCGSDPYLSYEEAVTAIADGLLTMVFNPDIVANTVTLTVSNNTSCSVPVSFGSYKMFGPLDQTKLSEQEFFDGSPTITVSASSTQTLSIRLPLCMTQYDVWYGDVQRVLVDNRVYGEFLDGEPDAVRFGKYCIHPTIVIPPVTDDDVTTTTPTTTITQITETPTPTPTPSPTPTPTVNTSTWSSGGSRRSYINEDYGVGGGGNEISILETSIPSTIPEVGFPNAGFGPDDGTSI